MIQDANTCYLEVNDMFKVQTMEKYTVAVLEDLPPGIYDIKYQSLDIQINEGSTVAD